MTKFSPKIFQAINKAAELHDGQKRKGDGLPYIVHPFSVALILMEYTQDEDIIVAGILHDVIEDTHYTAKEMKADFSPRIAKYVMEVTEPPKKLSWEIRKAGYLAHLKEASFEAKLICAADKLHNLLAMKNAYAQFGKKAFARFNSTPAKRLWFYEECVKILATDEKMPRELIKELKQAMGTFRNIM